MRLVMVGDVMIGRLVNKALTHHPPEYVWGDTLPLFEAGDLNICNLECALSDRGLPWMETVKIFHFRSDARNVAALTAAGIDFVSVANNHILDFGYEAMDDTLAILHDNAIGFAGAGRDLVEASSPYIREALEERVAFISFTDNEPGWAADLSRRGVFYVPIDLEDERAAVLLDLISETRKRCELLIVMAHWGPNWGNTPPEEHIPFGHALVDAGADIVFGHSGHVFRGIEIYRGKPIIYCAGNFIDDYAIDELERNDESFLFAVEETRGSLEKIELYPTVIRNFQAKLAEGERRDWIAGKMAALCSDLGTLASWQPKSGSLTVLASAAPDREASA